VEYHEEGKSRINQVETLSMQAHIFIISIIVLSVVVLQFYFFWTNLQRMKKFKNIFSKESTWRVDKDLDSVKGVDGEGNTIFRDIKASINKYIGSNRGSVIDFHLLKDAVDRHCDSVEDDINAQTPVPLYIGLAGTMIGVVIGLASLLAIKGGLQAAVTSSNMTGVSNLLKGVALAMVASFFGIVLTTLNSLLFNRRYKIEEEKGKNSFLAWMQSELLPALPSDTSEVMQNLVHNLNRFNDQFTDNISVLSKTFDDVNRTYDKQSEILQLVNDMDVKKMATANVKVLKELQSCTEKLEQFNQYLDSLNDFNYQFSKQAETQQIFKNISDFFDRHKSYVANSVSTADALLKDSMKKLNDTSSASVDEMKAHMVTLSENFKKMLDDEKKSFEDFSSTLRLQFDNNMKQMPNLSKQLEAIADIPNKLKGISDKMMAANAQLEKNMERALDNASRSERDYFVEGATGFPRSLKYWIIGLLSFMALCMAANTGYNIFINDEKPAKEQVVPATQTSSLLLDSHLS